LAKLKGKEMIVYSIKIDGVKTATVGSLTNVVKQVNYTVTGVDGTQSFSLPTKVVLADPEPQNFVSFQNLTESQVVAWVENLPETTSVKAHIQLVVNRMVQEASYQESNIPWAPIPAPVPAPIP
jgi:hypothetical protein